MQLHRYRVGTAPVPLSVRRRLRKLDARAELRIRPLAKFCKNKHRRTRVNVDKAGHCKDCRKMRSKE